MRETVLVTGASGGIGRALAHEFARHGYDLVLVARDRAALEAVARDVSAFYPDHAPVANGPAPATAPGGPGDGHRHQPVRIVPADLAVPHSARALVDELRGVGARVDVVVNNAGFGLQGEFATLALERQLGMIQLNVVTLTELTRLLLPEILVRNRGGVLNVASTAAFQPGPLMAVYYATKAYVLSFTEAIAEEVAGSGIKVSCLCPGPTATGFAERAEMTGTNLFKGSVMNVEQVAREGFDGWQRGRIVVIPGTSNRTGTMVVRFAPRAFVRRVVKRLNSQATSS